MICVLLQHLRDVLFLKRVPACRRCGRPEAAHYQDDAAWISAGCPDDYDPCSMYLPGWGRA